MLVLSRRVGESVTLRMGKELVEVIVSQTGDGKVRLGFLATDNVTIDRKEIDDAKQKEKR